MRRTAHIRRARRLAITWCALGTTHGTGLPALTTNCSNNYGPFQFPEKLIPLMIPANALEGETPSGLRGRPKRARLALCA